MQISQTRKRHAPSGGHRQKSVSREAQSAASPEPTVTVPPSGMCRLDVGTSGIRLRIPACTAVLPWEYPPLGGDLPHQTAGCLHAPLHLGSAVAAAAEENQRDDDEPDAVVVKQVAEAVSVHIYNPPSDHLGIPRYHIMRIPGECVQIPSKMRGSGEGGRLRGRAKNLPPPKEVTGGG